jgi:hypothetical protein
MRRIVTILFALAAAAMAAIMSASAAYAVIPAEDGASEPTIQVIHHHAALVGWQLGLIVSAAAILIAMTGALVARRVRNGRHRLAIG